MDGTFSQNLKALGSHPIVYWGSFAPNGASNPLVASSRYPLGLRFTVTYAATGVYTVTLPEGFGLPAQPGCIGVWIQGANAAAWYDAFVVGETTLNTTARQFVIQAHRSGVAHEPAAAAGTRINFAIFANDSTGG